jgi:hypothetical protein
MILIDLVVLNMLLTKLQNILLNYVEVSGYSDIIIEHA